MREGLRLLTHFLRGSFRILTDQYCFLTLKFLWWKLAFFDQNDQLWPKVPNLTHLELRYRIYLNGFVIFIAKLARKYVLLDFFEFFFEKIYRVLPVEINNSQTHKIEMWDALNPFFCCDIFSGVFWEHL